MLAPHRPRLRLTFLAGLVVLGGLLVWRERSPQTQAVVSSLTKPPSSSQSKVISAARPAEAPPLAPAKGNLFTFVQPTDAEISLLAETLPAPTRNLGYVRVNAALLNGKASPFWRRTGEGRVVFPLENGGALTVVIDGSEMLGADRFVSTGHIEGRPQSTAIFAYNAGFLHATVDDPALGSRVLRVATAELSQFYRVDPALVAPCGGERRPFVDGATLAAAAEHRTRAGAARSDSTSDPLPAADATAGVEVHVMMAVTQDVLTTLTGSARTAALTSAFDAALARVNGYFAASQIAARLRLVKVAETTYDETRSAGNKVQDEALTALQSTTDGQMDELHALRDQCGADLVCLALNRNDFASSGLAFVIDSPGDTTNALFAFSVVNYASVAGTTVVAHEFGHSFGCAHDRENAFSPGAYSYSYGYRFFGLDGQRYRDIMAYPPGIELGYFSNPAIVAPAPVGVPLGIPAGRTGESDTARTIREAAFEVSGYRLQTQSPVAAGTLINVATRANVGPDDRAVIASFTVGGMTPKTVLVRAAGPALTAFGVSDAAPDASLELFSGATRLAVSLRWSTQPDAAAISVAATQAGAFAFAPGSADAALLMTLPPGGYTAVVRSSTSAGSVLAEAYEIAPGASRLINLATRAYADRLGHPVIAGFVVRGEPGTTKRVLIRVRGPSLARPPFNVPEAMDDPLMELHGAAGELLVKNDDWSTGAQGGASPVNDFSPLVKYYNEQQIAATGLAPANRREPCLLLDLPPGNYTVVVLPYEQLPDEPAKPGIALVEVFEIGSP